MIREHVATGPHYDGAAITPDCPGGRKRPGAGGGWRRRGLKQAGCNWNELCAAWLDTSCRDPHFDTPPGLSVYPRAGAVSLPLRNHVGRYPADQ
jgi:hypothetical protein